jgi:aryl-alcohol dehydrogenase-like predicted oxidoreductase
MNYRSLGKSGLQVSEVGFGCWGIGGIAPGTKSYGPVPDEQSVRALAQARDLGINFFDTSDLYGLGHSEEILARAFGNGRAKVLIASKSGVVLDGSGRQVQDFSPGHIRDALTASLRRLQTDYLDLYQLHDPSIDALRHDPRPIEVLEMLQREGQIRAWGISARSPADGLIAVKEFHAPAVQVNFNLIDQRALEIGLLELCAAQGVGVIARTPLCFGFLTGNYTADTKFDPADHRAGWPREQLALWAAAPQLFRAAIKPPAEHTPGQLALRYCLSYAEISTVIPGIMHEQEARENAAVSAWGPLTDAQRQAAEKVYRQHTFFAPRKGTPS